MAWRFLNQLSISKSPQIVWTARSGSAYGNRYVYDNAGFSRQGTFQGDWLEASEVQDIVDAAETPMSEAGSSVTLNCHGVDWTGKVISCQFDRILSTDYYRGTVVLDDPQEAP